MVALSLPAIGHSAEHYCETISRDFIRTYQASYILHSYIIRIDQFSTTNIKADDARERKGYNAVVNEKFGMANIIP